jgi:hypothetical protein
MLLGSSIPYVFHVQAENPIPFADSFLTRFLSTGHLHARYAWLLLFPLHMSADWSFNCIPLVESLKDPRNLATLGLYCTLVYWTLSAAPLKLAAARMKTWCSAIGKQGSDSSKDSRKQPRKAPKAYQQQQQEQQQKQQQQGLNGASPDQQEEQSLISSTDPYWHARLRLVVVAGLLVGPFFPASNVVMYVGTFIGERLLYFPSVGYCWLVADLLGRLLPASLSAQATQASEAQTEHPAAESDAAAGPVSENGRASSTVIPNANSASSSSSSSNSRVGICSTASGSKAKGVLLGFLLVLLLGGFSIRTWLRCFDWLDEEKLFLSAMKVCPDSCKVRLNTGIVFRRRQQWETALSHFRWGEMECAVWILFAVPTVIRCVSVM